jgi:BirA family transcriptional regulator, biotin operon repressor / biotin---[acetyl-CoA-carboxylase] ligase
VPGPWSDLDRPPLSAARLAAALCRGGLWRVIRVVETTSSTNADARAAAEGGAGEGLVIVAEQQTAGRGRLDRIWESPPRAGVLMSMLLRPEVPAGQLPLLPLLTAVAVVEAVRSVAEISARVKWPNDVLVDGAKLGGILLERLSSGAAIVGIGLNVTTRADELPVETATSVRLAGGVADRESLVKEILRSFERRYSAYVSAKGEPESVLPAYRELCETLERDVVVLLPDGASVSGIATAVDEGGMLVVRQADGVERSWSAGDVVHVRGES